MRVLWLRAPLLLRRHRLVLAAVVLLSALSSLALAATPLVRAAVESESLQDEMRTMSPFEAGLEVQVPVVTLAGDRARRAAAAKLGRSLPLLGPTVATSLVYVQTANPGGALVGAMSRTAGAAQVEHETKPDGPGVWISSLTAQTTHLRPGGTLLLTAFGKSGLRTVRLRVAGIYRRLDEDFENPYWANWLHDIRPESADSPPLPAFVLMDEQSFQRVARAVGVIQNRYEFPVDPSGITVAGAESLLHRFAALRGQIRPGTALGRELGCTGSVGYVSTSCSTSSSLEAALLLARGDVAAVSPTIRLLSDCGLIVALALCVAAGVMLVRRRADEVHALFARGEAPSVFAARAGLESLLPAAAGAVAGFAVALLAVDLLAPNGAVDTGTVEAAALRALAGGALALVCVAAGTAWAFPRRMNARRRRSLLARVPWEIVPLAAAGIALWLVVRGHGLTHDANGASHPRLAVFVVPVLAAAGLAGLATRAIRRGLRGRGGGAPIVAFLALRRLQVRHGLLAAVVVAGASAFGAFAYAATLSASLTRSTTEKAYVANGSNVQGFVDPSEQLTSPFPFPAAIVEVDEEDAFLPSGDPIDLIAGPPAALERTILWGRGFRNDPRPLLPRLQHAPAGTLAAIASPGAPDVTEIVDQGVRVPVKVVGHAAIPGSTAGRPALLVSRSALHALARAHGFPDPGYTATGYVWARGQPAAIERALVASNLGAAYLTTPSHVLANPGVRATKRSYGYVKLLGAAAAVLSVVALLLYLQARQRAQVIATALTRRMGLEPIRDAAALALEAAAIVVTAGLVGGAAAELAVRPIVTHVDALPQYAPPPSLVVPWTTLLVGLVAAAAAAAIAGALSSLLAARADVGKAIRVA